MTYTKLKNGITLVETKDAIRNENKMKAIQHNIIDLYWEYDRMSSSGQKSLEALAKIVGVPTEKEMKQESKVTGGTK